jgi:hypothetical protein
MLRIFFVSTFALVEGQTVQFFLIIELEKGEQGEASG